MLCEICIKALSHFKVRTEFCPHHSSVESLGESVQAKCFLCCALWHHVFGQYTRDGDLSTSSTSSSEILIKASSRSSSTLSTLTSDKDSLLFTKDYSHFRKLNFDRVQVMNDENGLSCIAVWLAGAELWESFFTFFPVDLVPAMFPDEGRLLLEDIARPTAPPVSLQNMELITNWLNVCTTSHNSCTRLDTQPKWFPTRLLNLSRAGFVRLVDTSDFHFQQNKRNYSTLSHRWQSSQPVICTLDNIATLREGMSVLSFPKTFQETIALVKKLGFEYLWIDSLCIVQDVEADWLEQAPSMDQIYANSAVNISATGARTSDEGLFFEEQTSVAAPCSLDFCYTGRQGSSIIVCNRLWNEEVDQAPLNSRAWVLQERLLAPRVLHFGRRQVFWECNTVTKSQQFRDGIPSTLYGGDEKWLDLRRNNLFQSAGSRQSRILAWLAIVERYSSCEMTFSEDKLLAIAGLARSFNDTFGGGYLAGLWRSELPGHLLWQTSGLSKPATRPLEYRAPSWSWAAVDGSVSYMPESRIFCSFQDAPLLKILVNVSSTATETVSGDPFTPCLFGRLGLMGHLLSVETDLSNYISPVKFSIRLSETLSPKMKVLGSITQAWALPDVPTDADELSHKYHFLPVLSKQTAQDTHRMLGLLLESAVPRQQVYRRVGLVDMAVKLSEPALNDTRRMLWHLGLATQVTII